MGADECNRLVVDLMRKALFDQAKAAQARELEQARAAQARQLESLNQLVDGL